MNRSDHMPGTLVLLTFLGALLVWTAWSALQRTVLLDDPQRVHGTGPATLPDMRVDINSASVAELGLLPAIGPGLADRIVEYRNQHGPFDNIDDVSNVSGIGEAIMQRMRPYVVAGRAVAPAQPASSRND